MAGLVTLKAKTRGKGARTIEYQGLGKQTPDTTDKDGNVTHGDVDVAGAVTTVQDALALVEGNQQKMLDYFALGFNYSQRQAAVEVDEFAGLLDGINWSAAAEKAGFKDDEKRGTAVEQAQDSFKRSVRALAKATGADVADVAPIVLSQLPKA